MRLTAIVLAAGRASRFGNDKLSAPFHGEPLIRHAVRAARAAPVERVVVVCPSALDIGDWTGGPEVTLLRIDSADLSASLKAGIAAVQSAADPADGAFIFLGDMPLVPHDLAARLAARLNDYAAIQPRCQGKPGHPVLLSSRMFPEIARLEGDRGAGSLLAARDDVAFFDAAEKGCTLDVDRAEDIARLEQWEKMQGND